MGFQEKAQFQEYKKGSFGFHVLLFIRYGMPTNSQENFSHCEWDRFILLKELKNNNLTTIYFLVIKAHFWTCRVVDQLAMSSGGRSEMTSRICLYNDICNYFR